MIENKGKRILERMIAPILLLLYPLRNIAVGVDLSDTTYSLANFMFMESKSGMQLFSTYLANVFGSLLMKLPGGNTMLFMNLYTALLVSALALICYHFYRKFLPYPLVFIGEIIAISLCWCPTVILYNYLTYLFFTIAILFLYQALVKEKPYLLLLAGVMLGFNVFVRFPNIAETALILAVWYYAFLHKKKLSKVMAETGLCLLGFLAGIGSLLLVISIKYGFSEYAAMLRELVVLGSQDAGYSPWDMVVTVLKAYADAAKWLLYFVLYGVAGVGLFSIQKEKAVTLKTFFYTVGGIGLIYYLSKRGMFNTNYRGDYLAMFQWVAILLLFTIAYLLWVVIQNKKTPEEKLLAALLLLLIAITPLGSNNYIYPNMNNMFLITPVILYAFQKLLQQTRTNKTIPLRVLLSLMLLATIVQSVLFGAFFVFRGGEVNETWDSKIEQNERLKGMHTSKLRKESLEELTVFCNEKGLIGKQVILYDFLPGLSYALEMPCAISTTYPEMDSYPLETFLKELTDVYKMTKMEKKEQPIIILSTQMAGSLLEESSNPKVALLSKTMVQQNYQKTFSNALFTVYQ